jgi:hypothetical protein
VAGITLVSGLFRSCRGHAAFDKASAGGFSSSSPARIFDDEDASRLPAQPALRLKPTSSAGWRSDPWDISWQMALPLAYPDSHPHDIVMLGAMDNAYIVDNSRACIRIGLLYVSVKDS